MEYFLWKATIGRYPKIDIGEAEYRKIVRAKQVVVQAIHLEHLWNALVENYTDFEKFIVEMAVESMIARPHHVHEFYKHRQTCSRKLSNLLSSCRSYLDQSPRWLKDIGGDDAVTSFKRECSEAYDTELKYRFMEALRNYTQHRGGAIDSTSYDARWIGLGEDGSSDTAKLRFSARASLRLDELRKDKKFKQTVLKEFEPDETSVDMVDLTRVYVEKLGGIHLSVRNYMKDAIESAVSLVRAQIARYSEVNSGDVVGLSAAIFDGDRLVEEEDLFDDLISWLEFLQKRNGTFKNLPKFYVSNEART